jgi:hypothetical protein
MEFARRAADPPFPAHVRLLGRPRPLRAPRAMPYADRRRILQVLAAAAAKLDAEQAAGLLVPADLAYLGALTHFVFGHGRSGQMRGGFIVGLADVRASRDLEYWTGALVHDGVHAHRQARARRWLDEIGPCDAQLDYLRRTGARAELIEGVRRFRDSRARQQARRRQAA